MKKEGIIFQTEQENQGLTDQAAHVEAVEFVQKNRDLLEHYARGKIKVEPAPPGLDTFAFDLEKNTIYVNSRFYKKLGLSEPRTYFATRHEIEHLLEKIQLLAEPKGGRAFERYLEKIKQDKAFGLMDNCVADIRENRAVTNDDETSTALERGMYAEDLFPSPDFSGRPRHIQFCEALLNESRVPDRELLVHPDVRAKLDGLKEIKNKSGVSLVDVMTRTDMPMSLRLRLQDRYIWPIVQELREKDIEDKNSQKPEEKGKGGNKGKGDKSTEQAEPIEQKPDSNDLFADDYAEAAERTPNAVPVEQIEEAFKEWQKTHGEDPLDRADRDYAEKIGVKPEDLRNYRAIVESLQRIINPETGESVIEELRKLIARIIARRLKPTPGPRYPVEEGEDLVDPAGLVSGVKGGNLEPKVWETTETIQRPGKMSGEVEISLVCDRSGSMEEGSKLIEQRRAAVLAMEVLKEFADQSDEERVNLIRPLEVRSEIYSFQATSQDSTPLKAMSKELGEKERIDVAAVLSSAPGKATTDYQTLETIEGGMDDETKKKILEGDLKKIVIVFTDGVSSKVDRVKTVLGKLRKEGVVAIGVGITEKGKSALDTYAPDARLAEKAEDLPRVLGDLLKEHLANV